MKKRTSSIVELPPNKLFLEDIEEILEILKEQNPTDITMEVNDYEDIKKIDEVKHKIEKIYYFEIKAIFSDFKRLILSFYRNKATIYTEKDLFIIGLSNSVQSIIKERERNIINFLFVGMYKNYLLITLWFFGAILLPPKIIDYKLYYYISTPVVILYSYFCIKYTEINYSTIILNYKKNNKNFFKRNQDDLLKIIIAGLLGAFLSNIDRIANLFKK